MENSLEPVLAESVEEDINQKMITFHIRQGVKFHDGSYLDAQAVAKNFEMFIDADRLPYQNYFEGIATPNDDTVIIKYGEYNNMLLPSWGRMPIISSESYREHSRDGGVEEYREWARTHVVGTGPFMLGEFVNGEHINWVRNPDYWKTGKPYLDSIKVWLIADTLTSQAMMEAEEADEWDGVPAKHVNDLVQKGFIDINGPYGSPFALCPDTTDPTSPWNKLKVRQALEYVLDKPEMLRSLEYNDIEPMNMIAPPGEWGYDPDYQARFFDPAKAKQLLVESGYPNGFNTKMLILNDYVNGEIGELVQAQARQIGINITLDTADPGRV
jgi:ABC-type transport system substrate-binding protein